MRHLYFWCRAFRLRNADQIFPGATAPLGTNVMSFQINGNRGRKQLAGRRRRQRGPRLQPYAAFFPSVDAIAEFRVVRGVYDAESGALPAGK